MLDNKAIGNRIRELRESANLTQDSIVEAVGVSLHHYSDLERGLYTPATNTLIKLCEYFKVSCDYILFGISEEPDSAVIDKIKLLDKKYLGYLEKQINILIDIQNNDK